MAETLLQKYGGVESVRQLVGNFYTDVIESQNLRRFFKDVDLDRLMKHQTDLFCQIMGGPENYKGRSMEDAHKLLGITRSDFEELAKILKDNLVDAGVEPADMDAIMSVVGSFAERIITN